MVPDVWAEFGKQGIFAIMLAIVAFVCWRLMMIIIDVKDKEIARIQAELEKSQAGEDEKQKQLDDLNKIIRESTTQTVILASDAMKRTQELLSKVDIRLGM